MATKHGLLTSLTVHMVKRRGRRRRQLQKCGKLGTHKSLDETRLGDATDDHHGDRNRLDYTAGYARDE